MTQRIFIRLLSIGSLAIMTIVVLFLISDAAFTPHGGFTRKYPPHVITDGVEIRLPYNSYYIAGFSGGSLYLGNSTAPLQLLSIKESFRDTTHIKLSIDNLDQIKYFNIVVKIDSPYFRFSDGAIPYIYRGTIGEWYATPHIDSVYFLDAVALNASSYAVRSLSSAHRENVIGKISRGKSKLISNSSLLQKQIDGVFCTDGMLHYDRETKRLVYLYYYRNEYIMADTNLTLLGRGTTIDTTSRVKLKTASISLDGQSSNRIASPPPTVNKQSCVSGKWLFVHSLVMAENENKKEFNDGAVIDVYDLDKTTYLFSFYLRGGDDETVKGIHVHGRKLYAIYDHSVQRYHLNEKYFKD
jgi:hypothetical protein